MAEIKSVKIKKPASINFILGQSHFIKTVEDLHEVLVGAVPGIKFGLAFCEASGPALIRTSGTEERMTKLAAENAANISCGHSFIIFLKEAFPLNVLNQVKNVSEVVTIFCATANEVEVIIAETKTGRGILGVVDGAKSKGVENKTQKKERTSFLRKIGYKLS